MLSSKKYSLILLSCILVSNLCHHVDASNDLDFITLNEMLISESNSAQQEQQEITDDSYRASQPQLRLSNNLNKLVLNNTSISAADINAILDEIQFSDVNRNEIDKNLLSAPRITGGDDDNNEEEIDTNTQKRTLLSTSRFSRPSPTTMKVGKASATIEAATLRMCRSAGGNPRTAPALLKKLRQIDLSQINNVDIKNAHATFTQFNKRQNFNVNGGDNGISTMNDVQKIMPVEQEQQNVPVSKKTEQQQNDYAVDSENNSEEQDTNEDLPHDNETEFRQGLGGLFGRRPGKNNGAGRPGRGGGSTNSPQKTEVGSICLPSAPHFRSADGSNNNLRRKEWGRQNNVMKRMFGLGPHYSDECGVKEPRTRAYAFDSSYQNIFNQKPLFSNKPLPNARVVTNTLMNAGQAGVKDGQITHMVMQFGQFIDHDLTLTPLYGAAEGESDLPLSQSCVKNNRCINHPECFCICNTGDAAKNKTCLDFRRSAGGQISLGEARQQLNELTPYMDASMIYGSSDTELLELRARAPDVGLLKVSIVNKKEQMPQETDVQAPGRTDQCRPKSTACFAAGDTRCNTHVGLASMHTLWLREHNRIGRQLHALNPKWSGERVFQETRRIVGAMVQRVTYRHWLPIVLGEKVMRTFGLTVRDDSSEYDCSSYSSGIETGTLSEFCTTAFRFGHTLVDNQLSLTKSSGGGGLFGGLLGGGGGPKTIRISDSYFDMSMFKRDSRTCDAVLGGLSSDREQKFDNVVANVLRNELFRSPTFAGHDLPARNIQRGRDHGQPGYAFFAWACQQRYGENLGSTFYPKLRTTITPTSQAFKIGRIAFDELPLRTDASRELQRTYAGLTPADVDFFAAGISETSIGDMTDGGGILGPTFACVVAEQFRMIKRGDRFFHTNPPIDRTGRASAQTCTGANAFNPCQLEELSRMSLAHIMCANDVGQSVQRNVFLRESGSNPNVNCDKLDKLDLNVWRDGAQCNKPARCQ